MTLTCRGTDRSAEHHRVSGPAIWCRLQEHLSWPAMGVVVMGVDTRYWPPGVAGARMSPQPPGDQPPAGGLAREQGSLPGLWES